MSNRMQSTYYLNTSSYPAKLGASQQEAAHGSFAGLFARALAARRTSTLNHLPEARALRVHDADMECLPRLMYGRVQTGVVWTSLSLGFWIKVGRGSVCL